MQEQNENGISRESTLYERIASGGPKTVNAAMALLQEYGYAPPGGRLELAMALAQAASDHEDEALRKMATFHPDKEFIESNTGIISTQQPATSTMAAPASAIVEAPVKSVPELNTIGGCMRGDCGHKNDVGSGANLSPAAVQSQDSQQTDLYHFAVLLILGLGGLTVLSLIGFYGYSHIKHHHSHGH